MAFLDVAPDFDGWKFSREDLCQAQRFLRTALERYAPDWIQCPRGELALHWKKRGPYSTCFLIWVAQVLYKLDRAKTAKSADVLADKFRELISLRGPQFIETFRELEIGAALSERFSPISFEPFVPKDVRRHSKPSSPDYGIKLPEGFVDIESTVLRVGQLDDWDREGTWISEQLTRWARAKALCRDFTLRLPIRFTRNQLSNESLRMLINAAGASRAGTQEFQLPCGVCYITWSPVLVFPEMRELRDGELPAGISHAVVVRRFLATDTDERTSELVLTSLRNSLNAKRKQRMSDDPYLIALSMGHYRIRRDGIDALVAQRIWPNTQYSGISGIVLYSTPAGFQLGDDGHSLWLQTNPRARVPVPCSLIEAFEGRKQYHWP
jgi:hypothetical protein